MKQVHYFSGVFISVFVSLHLMNHLTSLISIELHILIMDYLRILYRNPIMEIILLTAIFLQIISGVRLFINKRKSVVGFYEQLQLWSGFYLAIFFMIHLSAVLIGRYWLNLDTNFYFGVAGLNTFPLNLFFIPYYGLAIFAFFGHIASVHYMKMKKEILGWSISQQANLILILGIFLAISILYGLTNGFQGVTIPSAYDIIIGK